MVYVITDGSPYVKIGFTQSLSSRICTLQSGNPAPLNVLMTFETDSLKNDKRLEKCIHNEFRLKRVVFDSGHETEWFDKSILVILGECCDFVKHISNKYNLSFKIVCHTDCDKFQVEDRRLNNAKSASHSADIYGVLWAKGHNQNSKEQMAVHAKSPKFHVGQQVRTIADLKIGRRYSGFFVGCSMLTDKSVVKKVYSNLDSEKCYYILDNGHSYAEEMLEKC